jgi:hypothetical protein
MKTILGFAFCLKLTKETGKVSAVIR